MSEDLETGRKQPIMIFCSYSHDDEHLRDELSKHLSVYKREGMIIEWHDRQIPPGENFEEAIDERINQAQIVLLLISPDFLDSTYCYEIEMKRALERHARGEAIVIPVILRPCLWEEAPFGKLQALPGNALPVTTWANQDEAFKDIAEGIRLRVEQLRFLADQPVTPRRPPRLDIEQFREYILQDEVKEVKVANPYLLGDKFVGREKELGDLANWLINEETRILCICDLGGTGKSALVWHWLNSQTTRDVLSERGIKQFWCSFYARSFDSIRFLHDLAAQLGGLPIDEPDTDRAQSRLKQFVLDRLKTGKWLLVLDGLEREMGAFADPNNYQFDNEEQDRRNEKGDIQPWEKEIRSNVFADFVIQLLKTKVKVLITSRLFPENLKSGEEPLPGVIRYPFLPMSPEDATKVWNLSGDEDNSPFQQEFFESIGYHPQVISVVAATVKEQPLSFSQWFKDFSETDRQGCLGGDSLLTVRRRRWLDLATRDLLQNRRDAWLTICYIVRRSEASSVEALMKTLVDSSASDETKPGRFRSGDKLIEVLNYLVKRRLIGVDFSRGLVDVHPVIRGQITRYIWKQYEPGGANDPDLRQHLESDKDYHDLLTRFLNQPDLEERFQSLPSVLRGLSDTESAQNTMLNILGKFYPDVLHKGHPWLDALPRLRLRKDQAWLLLRTGNELMTRGLWDESAKVFNRASIAYHLCGDLKSIEDCRHSHNWQYLYGGLLHKAEEDQLTALEKGDSQHAEYATYWLALLLSIRRSDHAVELLQSLPSETNRWTLQTVAEAWFYLEEYEKAASLAREAWERRDKERDSSRQSLWEAVTLGLALVRMEKDDDAEFYLDHAKSRGTGWSYNLVPMFALAGFIEMHYHKALRISHAKERREQLSKADLVYKQYYKYDPHERFQIPAAEANLVMARVHLERKEKDEAIKLAQRALEIARGQTPPFHYASVVRRATQFLTAELKEPEPPAGELNLKAVEHEERLRLWMEARNKEK